jgi:hypothetical protein
MENGSSRSSTPTENRSEERRRRSNE